MKGGKLADPAWRHARAVKAGAANRAAHARRRLERGKRFRTKGAAYTAGYVQGYQAAMNWWRRKYQRERGTAA